jgi:hypothetical protein
MKANFKKESKKFLLTNHNYLKRKINFFNDQKKKKKKKKKKSEINKIKFFQIKRKKEAV